MHIGKRLIKIADHTVNLMVLILCFLLLAYGCYAMWDSQQLYEAAGSTQYEQYKPTKKDTLSFEELKKINPEVFGWLTVYGTNMDYPLVQGTDNSKYVNTDAKGSYALSGSLFLDYRNSSDFTDFNSIIYGHHMDKQVMFGEIADFKDESYFDSHRYGKLYFGGQELGLEFFAFLEVDAYGAVYSPGIQGGVETENYLQEILSASIHTRDINLTESEHLVLLSTCTSDVTNGRHILVGRLTEDVKENPFAEEEQERQLTGIDAHSLWSSFGRLPLWQKTILILVILALLLVLADVVRKGLKTYRKRRREKK